MYRLRDRVTGAPIKPRKRCASGDPQLQIFRLPFRGVPEQSLEGVFCLAMASDYQANYLVGSRPVERNHLVIHGGDRLIDKFLVVFDCRVQESEYRVVREAE